MTNEEWKNLEVGSIVSNKFGKNFRAIIKVNKAYGLYAIRLPTNKDHLKRGWTTYVIGDRSMFLLKGKIRKK